MAVPLAGKTFVERFCHVNKFVEDWMTYVACEAPVRVNESPPAIGCGLLNSGGALMLTINVFVANARRPSGHCTSASTQQGPSCAGAANVWLTPPKIGSCPCPSHVMRALVKFVSATSRLSVTDWPGSTAFAGGTMTAFVKRHGWLFNAVCVASHAAVIKFRAVSVVDASVVTLK